MNASTSSDDGSKSSSRGSNVSVAPKSWMRLRRDSTRSLTTTSLAPYERAASETRAPIGPAPVTKTRDPGSIPAFVHAQMPTENGSRRAAAWSDSASGTRWAKSAGAVT